MFWPMYGGGERSWHEKGQRVRPWRVPDEEEDSWSDVEGGSDDGLSLCAVFGLEGFRLSLHGI